VLVDRTPEIVNDAVDADENLIYMPGIAGSWPPSTQPLGEFGAELAAPMADTFAGDHDAALRQDEFNVAQAEAEQVIQPHGVADDLTRKAMAAMEGWLSGLPAFSPVTPPQASPS
jgi:hypothetical protein